MAFNRNRKFRLYPSKTDEEELQSHMDICRQLYNHCLEQMNESDGIPAETKLQNQLPSLKEEWPELSEVHSKVLQMVVKQLYSNLRSLAGKRNNGHKIGRLRYKGEGWWKTIEYNQSGFRIEETDTRLDYLHLSKIGDIPIRLHRPLDGNVKGVIVKQYADGSWYAIFQIENEQEEQVAFEEQDRINAIGIDLGIENFIVDSDATRVAHPKNVEKSEERLKRAQRDLARKDKGSNNWERQRQHVAKLHNRVKNRRIDFLHKLSTAYVENYDVIAVEDLNVSAMMEDDMNSKNTADSAWRTFIQMLLYKAESAGTEIVLVNPANTTKECSQCGVETDKGLWQREHECPSCSYTTDRDYNAAQNILKRGLEQADSLGTGQAEGTPVDTGAAADTNTYHDVSASTVVEAGSSSLASEAS